MHELNFNIINSAIDYEIICLTETWLTDQENDSIILNNKYNNYRSDRDLCKSNKKTGGGVMLSVKKEISSSLVYVHQGLYETVCLLVRLNKINLIISALYMPPLYQLSLYEDYIKNLKSVLFKYNNCKILLLGDFNIPGYKFKNENNKIKLIGHHSCKEIRSIANFIKNEMNNLELLQFNQVYNYKENILDVVFSNLNIEVTECIDPLLKIDKPHPPLDISINCNYNLSLRFSEFIYDFKNCNYDLINIELNNINWSNLFNNVNCADTLLDIFYKKLNEIIHKHVPRKKVYLSTFPNWFSSDLIKAIILKKILHRIYKQNMTEADKYKFTEQRRMCNQLKNRDYERVVERTESEVFHNNKAFWDFININNQKGIPSEMIYNNLSLTNVHDIVNSFADFFSSTYKNINLDLENYNLVSSNNSILNEINIDESDINSAFKDINFNTAPGPDKIHPNFIKNTKMYLSHPLLIIFKKSIESGIYPKSWKFSFITPIYKNGDKNSITNYRPITIIKTFAKLFESIIYKKILAHLNDVIINEQHGSIKKKSIETNLLTYKEDIIDNLITNSKTYSIYTDAKKAFDTINHKLLLYKLEKYGIKCNVLDWFKSYLQNRIQYVRIHNFISKEISVTSGAPQGSHFGALLYIIYINDIINVVKNSKILLYIDDLKLYKKINNENDLQLLNDDLQRIIEWNKLNGLEFNEDKCRVMIFSKKLKNSNFKFYIANHELEYVYDIKDLGIIFDNKLSFKNHIQYIISKAKKSLWMLKQYTKKFNNRNSIILLYNTLVKSKLMFGSVIWNPQCKNAIYDIEKV